MRSFVQFALTVILAGFGFANGAKAETPNIVVILADDLGYGDVKCYNPQSKIPTPRLDRLAREGMRFTDAHSASSVCTPTRYALLTGRYPWRTRLQSGVLNGYSPPLIAPDRMTIATLLKSAGYATACVGKWHLGLTWATNKVAPDTETKRANLESAVDWTKPIFNGPTHLGFDYFYGISASLDMPPYVFIENDRVTAIPTTQKKWIRAGAATADFEAENTLPELADKAVAWIKQQAASRRPFFLYFPLTAPHTPILPTKEWQDKSGLNAYGDFVMQTDATVGRVLDALDAAGIAKNTLVIFTADNGCSPAAGTGEMQTKGHHASGQWRGFKADIWEGGHRVPFLARWPARVKAGTTSTETICLGDLLATSADIVEKNLPDGAGEDSVSILPALLGKKIARSLREATVHHSIEGKFAIRQGPWKLALCPGSGGWSTPKDAAAAKQNFPPVQLFNLTNDPAETKNIQADRPEIVARLTRLLEKYVAAGRSTPGKPRHNDAAIDLWKIKSQSPKTNSPSRLPARQSSGPPIEEKSDSKTIAPQTNSSIRPAARAGNHESV